MTNHSKTFNEWEKTIDKTKKVLIIPNYLHFEDDKLVIKQADYPNLETLYANSCALREVEINCPSLQRLQLNDNKIKKIDLRGVLNLKNLVISNNQLVQLDVWFLEDLETLWCFNNRLRELNVSYLEKLEDLNCSENSWNNDKGFVEEPYYLTDLNTKGCDSLKIMDVDMNNLQDLDFSHLTFLEEISLKFNGVDADFVIENSLKDAKVNFNSPYLQRIDISNSNITSYENIHKTEVKENNKIDEGYASGAEDSENEWEKRNYERQQQKEKKQFEEGSHVWEGQEYLDLSNCDFFKSITIDGNNNYPKSLTSINLGGNYLNEVVVRNLPNLRRLIISHNSVKKLTIDNCDQLDIIYDYKSNDNERAVPINGRAYDDERDNPFKQAEEQRKREEKRENAVKELIKILLEMLEKAEQLANEGKWEEVKKKITEIKSYLTRASVNDSEIQNKIYNLETRYQTMIFESEQKPKIIIGLGVFLTLILGSLVFLTNKWIKKFILLVSLNY